MDTIIPPHPDAQFDVVVIGRAGLDLYPLPDGVQTHQADQFSSDLGGSAGNIAVALSKYGCKVGLCAPVSDDPVGQFVIQKLAHYGVRHLTPECTDGPYRTSLAIAETICEGSRTVIYRNDAADFQMPVIDANNIKNARALVVTGTALAQNPSRDRTLDAMTHSPFVVLDLDYRPYSWGDDAAQIYKTAADAAHLIVGNEEEFNILGGRDDAQKRAENGQHIIYKKGANGSRWFGDGGYDIPPFTVNALKPFGAGDAFLGGVLFCLLSHIPVAKALKFGSAAAAIVISKRGCASAMPDQNQTQAFITQHQDT